MKNNLITQSLIILSQDALIQEKYIQNLFKDEKYNNTEELILEFEDAKFMIENYLEDEKISILFVELEKILDEIDSEKLFYTNQLTDHLWEKVRFKSKKLLNILNKYTS